MPFAAAAFLAIHLRPVVFLLLNLLVFLLLLFLPDLLLVPLLQLVVLLFDVVVHQLRLSRRRRELVHGRGDDGEKRGGGIFRRLWVALGAPARLVRLAAVVVGHGRRGEAKGGLGRRSIGSDGNGRWGWGVDELLRFGFVRWK
jgi:hypothetical protein